MSLYTYKPKTYDAETYNEENSFTDHLTRLAAFCNQKGSIITAEFPQRSQCPYTETVSDIQAHAKSW